MTNVSKLTTVELRPNRNLIDSKFDSYKLSLTTLPSYKAPIRGGIYQVVAGDSDIGYDRIRCLTLHNYLILDPWNKDDVYYVDSNCCLQRFHVALEIHIEPSKAVFSLGSDMPNRVKKLPPSLFFPSATLCVICDGFGAIFVLDTGLRSEQNKDMWKIVYYDEDKSSPSLLLQAVYRSISQGVTTIEYLDCLFMKFQDENDKDTNDASTKIILEWTCLEKGEDEDEFKISEVKLFQGKSTPMYAAVSPDCSSLHIASSSPFEFKPAWDTEASDEIGDLQDGEGDEPTSPPYRWKQDTEDVLVYVDLPPGTLSTSIAYSLSSKYLSIALRESETGPKVILNGNLYLDADPECSSWVIENDQLEVTIQKRIEGRTWLTVVEGDDRGEYIADPDEVAKVHQQLAHLTSETLDPNQPSDGKLFNSDQLEECDSYYDSTATIMRFDVGTNRFSHAADISSLRWLFNYTLTGSDYPAFVLRHDVDAVAWKPISAVIDKDSKNLWEHIATFNALGYVHASKTNLKFCASPPDASFAAFCECQRRIYVYRQPTPLMTSLRNRSSGTVIGKIAIQQVATLEDNADILGFAVSSERMYVLTREQLIVFKVVVSDGA